MKYQVDRKALAALLTEKTSIIKKITNPNEDFILDV